MQEPCACARAAVDAKRDVSKLKHEVKTGIYGMMNRNCKDQNVSFFPTLLVFPSLVIKCELVDRNQKRKQKNQLIIQLIPNPFTRDLEGK